MKILITAVVTLAVAAGIYFAYGHWSKSGAQAVAEPTAVRIEPARMGDLVEVVNAPGTIEPRTKVSISAKISARITELPFKEGDHVTKGDPSAKPPVPASVLVRLDASDLESELRSAQAHYLAEKAQITVAEARIESTRATMTASRIMLADAQRDLDRQKGLLSSQDVSQSVFDQAQAKVDQLKAQLDSSVHSLAADQANIEVMQHTLDAADADIQKVRDELTYTVITSPIDGTVTRLNAKVGEMVVTGIVETPEGNEILEVADLSGMIVEARVDEASIALVEPKQHAIVHSAAYPDDVFDGIVTEVGQADTEDKKDNSKYFKVKVQLNTRGQRPFSGVTADVDIETRHHPNVIEIPSQAVLGRPVDELPEEVRRLPQVDHSKVLATVVYRAINGKAVVTPVTVGPSDATQTMITSGLAAGDKVIVGPFKVLDALTNDQRVKDNSPPATTPAK